MEQLNTGNEEIRILTVRDLGHILKIGRDKAYENYKTSK